MLKPSQSPVEGGTCVSLRHTVKGVVIFYAAALLLNADGLHRSAERLPYGTFRDTVLVVTKHVAVLGRQFHFTLVRSLAERIANAKKEGVN